MKKKTLTIAIALVLVVALAVGATYALLTADTKAVTNTFVAGKLTNDEHALTLKEHDVKQNADGSYALDKANPAKEGNTVKYDAIVPGTTIAKDPTVTVQNLTGDAYLYIVVKDTVNNAVLIHSVDATKWTKIGENTTDGTVLYKYALGKVGAEETKTPLNVGVLTDNRLTAAAKLTEGAALGEIIVNAYLVQAVGTTNEVDAWNVSPFADSTGIKPETPTPAPTPVAP